MMKWLAANVFLASWLSVVIALAAMLQQSIRSHSPIKWSTVTLRLGFLIGLSAILTPGIDAESKRVLEGLTAGLMGVLIVRSGQE